MISTEAYNTIYFSYWQQPQAVINGDTSQPYECGVSQLSSNIIQLRLFIPDYVELGLINQVDIYNDFDLSILLATINQPIKNRYFVARFMFA